MNLFKRLGLEGYLSASIDFEVNIDPSTLESLIDRLFHESGIVSHYDYHYSSQSSNKLLANEIDRYINHIKSSSKVFDESSITDDLEEYVTLKTIALHRYTNAGAMKPAEPLSLDNINSLSSDYITLLTYYFNMSGISDYISDISTADNEAYDKANEVITHFKDYLEEIEGPSFSFDIASIDIYAEQWFTWYNDSHCQL